MAPIKKSLLVANWKMNPLTLKEAERIVRSLEHGIKSLGKKDFISKIDLALCPPSLYLGKLENSPLFRWGIQNVHWETRGPFTGEVSLKMAEDAGCRYAIIGHSERRRLFGETDAVINLKLRAAFATAVSPILCVGENKEERKKDQTSVVIRKQLAQALQKVSVLSLPKLTIAYEPVWAISDMSGITSTRADSPDDIMGISILIKKILTEFYHSDVTEKVRIIYGGSVNQKNIDQFIEVKMVDGFLVGGASLTVFDFLPIIRKVYERS